MLKEAVSKVVYQKNKSVKIFYICVICALFKTKQVLLRQLLISAQ